MAGPADPWGMCPISPVPSPGAPPPQLHGHGPVGPAATAALGYARPRRPTDLKGRDDA